MFRALLTASIVGLVTGLDCTYLDLSKSDQEAASICSAVLSAGKVELQFGYDEAASTTSFCALNLQGNGWIAFGPGEGMKGEGTRAVVASSNKEAVLKVMGYTPPVTVVTDLGETNFKNDVIDGGKRRSCFTMPLSKLHPSGKDSVKSASFAYATGGASTVIFGSQHGPITTSSTAGDAGVYVLDLESGAGGSQEQTASTLIVFHLVCMILAFCVLYPLGALVGAYAGPQFVKGVKFFKLHRNLMTAALVLTASGLVLAFINSPFDTVHGYFGLPTAMLCFIQPLNAFLRPGKDHTNRRKWEYLHKSLGRITVLLGFTTCVLGALRFSLLYGFKALVLAIAIVPIVVFVPMYTYYRIRQERPAALPRKKPLVASRD